MTFMTWHWHDIEKAGRKILCLGYSNIWKQNINDCTVIQNEKCSLYTKKIVWLLSSNEIMINLTTITYPKTDAAVYHQTICLSRIDPCERMQNDRGYQTIRTAETAIRTVLWHLHPNHQVTTDRSFPSNYSRNEQMCPAAWSQFDMGNPMFSK